MNIAMIGHGMMGVWHSEALPGTRAVPHALVGRREEPTREFADKYGYRRWTLSYDEALADPEVEAVIVASPSEAHVDHALRAMKAGKHVLIEIPIAMDLRGSEAVVNEAEAAQARGQVVAVCHPKRLRPESVALRERIARGEETALVVEGRFFIHRLKNVGATGYHRSWTDNVLWHHAAHLVDFGAWMLGQDQRFEVKGWLAPIEPRTGVPMTTSILGVTPDGRAMQSLLTYYSRERVYEITVVTDRDSYRLDILRNTLVTGDGPKEVESEQANCAHVTHDFIDACLAKRRPAVTPADVLPAMRILQEVQDAWDAIHGAQDLPGRALPQPPGG